MNGLKVVFDVYAKLNGTNLINLNLSVCEGIKISILIPNVSIDNIDKFNPNSGYYNDICYTATSSYGTDITLKDRLIEYAEYYNILRQEGCDFSEYNYETLIANYSCNVKKINESFTNMQINEENEYKILNNFKKIKNFLNFKILTCYRKLFNKEGIINNIGCFILFAIILFHIITIIVFSINQFSVLKNKIKKITYEKKLSKKYQIKTKKKSKHKNTNKKNIENTKISRMKTLNESRTTIKSKEIKNNETYIDEEINGFPYELAIQYDKRNYCAYYASLLKTQHNLIYTFCNCNDYNSVIIKIDLFLIGISIDYIINAFFYNDDTIHEIYINRGAFFVEFEISKSSVYSTIISMVLNYPLNYLALSNDPIIDFKQNNKSNNIKKRAEILKNNLLNKFISYFIISSLFLLFFWYYISMFGVIYRNTQIYLLKDTFVSFILSLIIPFIIYLFPGCFRICALSNANKKRECLYKFSKCLQSI